MAGLSQSELDALCCGFEAAADEPSSPIGSSLLARKRQREAQRPFLCPTETLCESGLEQGLSQAELDAFCIEQEAPSDAPSSPVGCSLLARKRQRERGELLCLPDSSIAYVDEEAVDGGLSQAALDELSFHEPATEDNAPSSPIGTSLRCIKNRRRFATLTAAVEETPEVTSEATPPLLRCPASWGDVTEETGGLSQAELDAMCGEEPEASEEIAVDERPFAATISAVPVQTSSLQASPARKGRLNVTTSPFASPNSSPPTAARRRRAKRADAENADAENAGASPGKAIVGDAWGGYHASFFEDKMTSVSPGQKMDMSPGAVEVQSPMRRSPGWGARSSLSPVLLN